VRGLANSAIVIDQYSRATNTGYGRQRAAVISRLGSGVPRCGSSVVLEAPRPALTQPDRLQRFTALDVLSQGAPNLSDESLSILRIAQHLRALRPLRVRQVPASSGCAPRGLLN
jgi:hypothetical protein